MKERCPHNFSLFLVLLCLYLSACSQVNASDSTPIPSTDTPAVAAQISEIPPVVESQHVQILEPTPKPEVVFPSYYIKGDEPQLKGVALLTIDDCVNEAWFTYALDLGKKFNLRFTFFPNTDYLGPHFDKILARALLEGHEIGYHTTDHKAKEDLRSLVKDLDKFQEAIRVRTGVMDYRVRVFRPPYLEMRSYYPQLFQQHGVPTIWFSSTDMDPEIALNSGPILLRHTRENDMKMLDKYIYLALERKLQFKTVTEAFTR